MNRLAWLFLSVGSPALAGSAVLDLDQTGLEAVPVDDFSVEVTAPLVAGQPTVRELTVTRPIDVHTPRLHTRFRAGGVFTPTGNLVALSDAGLRTELTLTTLRVLRIERVDTTDVRGRERYVFSCGSVSAEVTP